MAPRHKSVETKFMEARDEALRALGSLDRRTFLKVAAASAGAVLARGLLPPHSFQLVNVAYADPAQPSWSFAYISDTHLYEKKLNERFVRAALKAVDDVNALSPQPDFVLFGGDLAQLGRKGELALGAQNPQGGQGAGEDDGGRARLVPRPRRRVEVDVRAADLLVRPQGRARRGADERLRARLLDRAQDDARRAHADGGRARQRHAVALRGRRRGARLARATI